MIHTQTAEADVAAPTFPWVRALAVMIALWATLSVAGIAGGRLGGYIYDDRYRPAPPYSEAELNTLRQRAPMTFAMAEHDMQAWRDSVEVGRSIARLEGTVIGGLLLLGLWGTAGVFWLWSRERERQARIVLDATGF